MNRDDIIAIALDTGFDADDETTLESLERFAALVAAAEREACADLCEDTGQEYERYTGQPLPLNYTCATAIRARGQS